MTNAPRGVARVGASAGRGDLCAAGEVTAAAGGPDWMIVRTQALLRSLVEHLLSGNRQLPLVLLTFDDERLEPVLVPERVRAVTGRPAEIYYVTTEYLLRRFNASLRRRLGESTGHSLRLEAAAVRIYWPGVSERSSPKDHPLVPELVDEHAWDLLAEFQHRFDLSRPTVRPEIRLLNDTLATTERELRLARNRVASVEEQLRDAQISAHEAQRRTTTVESRLRDVDHELSEMDTEERLQALIARQWRSSLNTEDRRYHPLTGYVPTPGFIESAEKLANPPLDRIARVCAMIASNYAQALTGLALHPLVQGKATQQMVRADGAKGWRCALKRNTPAAPRLHYWVRKDGTIEFDSVGKPRPPHSQVASRMPSRPRPRHGKLARASWCCQAVRAASSIC